MKKIVFIAILLILLGACSNQNDSPVITGEIIEIDNGRFLVESTEKSAPDANPELIWFSTDEINDLKVGQIVSVWADAVAESYPGQATATKVKIIK